MSLLLPTSRKWRLLCLLSLVSIFLWSFFYQFQSIPNYKAINSASSEVANEKFPFEKDLATLSYPYLDDYRSQKPHHLVPEERQETFATFLCSLNASIYDPYFAATLNLVYRSLWSPSIASKSRPFTVFVAPFTSQEQRNMLAGAGAVIQELEILPGKPNDPKAFGRYRDQFSTLNLFNQTQYSAIAFMDSDTFPITNIDSVFDEAIIQRCDVSKLDALDAKDEHTLCEYEFAGVEGFPAQDGVNGGFIVLAPNAAMHEHLLRNYVLADRYEATMVEQSFLAWQFGLDGAFPYQILPRKYNAIFPTAEDEGQVSVVHEKLWALNEDSPTWLQGMWENGWNEMLDFFDSIEFVHARTLDGLLPIAHGLPSSIF